MKIEETEIVYGGNNPQLPKILYRCGRRYFLLDHSNVEWPLTEINEEVAWDLLGIAESVKNILRQSD